MTIWAPKPVNVHIDLNRSNRRRSPVPHDKPRPGALSPRADLVMLRRQIDQLQHQVASTARKRGAVTSLARPIAFMAMPFGPEDLQIVYDDFVKPVVELKCGLDCIRGDDIFGSNVIMEDVLAVIRRAKVVIADLTGQNPNVCYELGIADRNGSPVLLLTQSLDDVPFDLRHRRVLVYEYSPRGCKRLESRLEEHLQQILEFRSNW